MDAKTGGKCLAWCEGSRPQTGSVNPSLLVEDAADRLSVRFYAPRRSWRLRFAGHRRGRAQPAMLFQEIWRKRDRAPNAAGKLSRPGANRTGTSSREIDISDYGN